MTSQCWDVAQQQCILRTSSSVSGPAVIKEDDIITEAVVSDASAAVVPPPPGYRQLSWSRHDWMVGGDPSLNTVMGELPGGSPWMSGGLPVDPPSLPVSPIVLASSDDLVAASGGIIQRGVVHSFGGCRNQVTFDGGDGCCTTRELAVAVGGIPVRVFTVGTGCFSPAGRHREWG